MLDDAKLLASNMFLTYCWRMQIFWHGKKIILFDLLQEADDNIMGERDEATDDKIIGDRDEPHQIR